MKRFITHLAIFLLIGAIFNVANAWVCAAWPTNSSEQIIDHSFDSTQTRWGDLEVERILLADLGWSLHEENLKDRSKVFVASSTAFGLEYLDIRMEHYGGCMPLISTLANKSSAGWPCLALTGVELNHSKPNVAYNNMNCLIETPLQMQDGSIMVSRYLPIRPIWPGFAINTVIYATFLWMITLGPFKLRRHLRRKRGSCLKCGYDLNHADHKACPECGLNCSIATE